MADRQAPAEQPGQSACQCQADARSLPATVSWRAGERVEHAGELAGHGAEARVGDDEAQDVPLAAVPPDLDRDAPLARAVHRQGQQLAQGLRQTLRVGPDESWHGRSLGELHLQAARIGFVADLGEQLVQQRRQVHLAQPQIDAAGLDARQVAQVFDEVDQGLG